MCAECNIIMSWRGETELNTLRQQVCFRQIAGNKWHGQKKEGRHGEFVNKASFVAFHLNALNQSKSLRTAWLHDVNPDILRLNC